MAQNDLIDDDDDVIELDEELLTAFSKKIESAINSVILEFPLQDSRIELMTILTSFASQVAIEAGMDLENFVDVCGTMYEQSLEPDEEQEESMTERVVDKKNLN